MKLFYTLLVMLVVLGSWLNVTSAQNIEIPDTNLAAIVRINLGLDPEEPITQQELRKLIVLDFNRGQTDLSDVDTAWLDAIGGEAGIKDLTGLEYATNLQSVNLPSNAISDITPLTQLTQLRALNLRDNKVSDLTLFGQLTQLGALELNYNQISDITPLTQLTQLNFLGLQGNQISDITPLAQLTQLNFLDISGNQISDLTPLAQLTRLRQLLSARIQTSNITPLAQLTELCWLFLGGNQISEITPLTQLTGLIVLSLSDNQISDITLLARFTHLERLDLSENQISDIGAIVHLVKLTDLGIPKHLSEKTAPIVELRANQKSMNLPEVVVYRDQAMPGGINTCPIPQESVDTATRPISQESVDTATRPPMYWIDTGSGMLFGATGDEAESFEISVQNPTSLAVDISGSKLYWTEKTSDTTGKIWQSNLDGSNVEVVKELTSVPLEIAIDTENGKLYLTNAWGKIQRMNLDGTDFQPNLITDLAAPAHITITIADGKVYWTEKTGDTTGRIRCANLDGSNIELVKELTSVPLGIAIDTENGKLYLTNAWGKIQRMNLDGTDFQRNLITDLEAPMGIAVSGDNIYWIEGNRIRRASLNGGDIFDVLISSSNLTAFALGISIPSDMPSTTDDEETTDTPVPIVFAAADVNEDGKVNKGDLLLVVTALGETSPANPRVDVNSDGTVAIADLLLVVEDLDDPGVGAAPAITELTTPVDWKVLKTHLHLLRVSSDGSFRYWYAIAFLEGLLASMRPDETLLLPNYPNPFNPETWIPYQLSTAADVRILIYDVRGVIVRRLELGHQLAGFYTGSSRAAHWDGRNGLGERVASGIYFYHLLTNEISSLRKMVILK